MADNEEKTPSQAEAAANAPEGEDAPPTTENEPTTTAEQETAATTGAAGDDTADEAPEATSDEDAPASEDAPAGEGGQKSTSDGGTTAQDEAPTEQADAKDEGTPASNGEAAEHKVTIEQLLKAGSHFGHLTSRWHPRMQKYIFMERNNIHIIDLMQTQVLLDEAADAARRFAQRGKTILFAGTKKQAQEIVREHAEECGMPFMVDRWLGGTMTNFQTIRRSIRRMEEIEKMEKDGTLEKLKKKEKLMRLREHEKLENTLGGIRDMARLPGAIFVVDVKREDIAVSEAKKLGIPIIAMVDTNCDPGVVDHPVPANDDALSSIELVTSTIAGAIQEGQHERQMKKEAKKKAKQDRKK